MVKKGDRAKVEAVYGGLIDGAELLRVGSLVLHPIITVRNSWVTFWPQMYSPPVTDVVSRGLHHVDQRAVLNTAAPFSTHQQ